MDSNRFDTISRALADSTDRRGAIRRLAGALFAGGLVAGMSSGRVADAQFEPCGGRCPSGQICIDNHCVSSDFPVSLCPAPLTICGNGCVDTRIDRLNCGDCDNICLPGTQCAQGECITFIS